MDARDAMALLYRRAGFGATSRELQQSLPQGYDSLVTKLLGGLTQADPQADAIAIPKMMQPPFSIPKASADKSQRLLFNKMLNTERVALTNWWIARMVVAEHPLKEKLTFFLHCHFPTAISKVRFPVYMYRQNQLFRSMGSGDFATLVAAVATDPAMLIWLDAAFDRMPDPNENFARELMERFTMGIGTYSELDVRAAAFAFTGWHLNQMTGKFAINLRAHSSTPVTFLGKSGVTTGNQVIDIVTRTSASARFVVASLWSRFAYPITPNDPLIIDLASSYAEDRNISKLLNNVFHRPEFLSEATATGLIKQPVEYVVGALKSLGVGAVSIVKFKPAIINVLASLGQVLFDPPSVGGWPQNEYWLSTSGALARWRFAHQLSLVGDVSLVADASPQSRLDAAAQLLSISGWSSASKEALQGAGGNPHMIVTLALVSPEYLSN